MDLPEHNTARESVPPLLQIAPWLGVSAFTRRPERELVVLTVEGLLRTGARPPKAIELLLRTPGEQVNFPVSSQSLQRLSAAPRSRKRAQLALKLSFEVPAELLAGGQQPELLLSAERREQLALPQPVSAPGRANGDSRAVPRLSARAIAAGAAIAGVAALAGPSVALAQGSASTTTTPTTSTPTSTTPTTTTPTSTTPTTTTPTTTTPTTTTPTTTTPSGGPGGDGGGGGNSGALSGGISSASGAANPVATLKHVHRKHTKKDKRKDHKRAGAKHHKRKHGSSTVSLWTDGANFDVPFVFSPVPVTGATVPWGGSSIFESPFTTAQIEQFATLSYKKVDPPSYLMADYHAAARAYDIPWEVLAAINYIETGYGQDLRVSSAGAEGWMQFMPSTWSQYGEIVTDLEIDGRKDPERTKITQGEPLFVEALTSLARAREAVVLEQAREAAERAAENADRQAAKTASTESVSAKQTDGRELADRRSTGAPAVAESASASSGSGTHGLSRRTDTSARNNVLAREAAHRRAVQIAKLFGARAAAPATVDGQPNPWNPTDAIFAAARMLVSDGAHKNMARAVYSYNHADWYVQEVLTVAQKLAIGQASTTLGTATSVKVRTKAQRRKLARTDALATVAAMRAEAHLLNGIDYVWGGGHAADDWIVGTGYDCSGFVSALLHAGGYLRYPVTTQTLPGQKNIEYGKGKYVTIYDRTDAGLSDDHVIIDLNGQWWESGGETTSGGASMVHRITTLSRSYLLSFNVVMHPRGL